MDLNDVKTNLLSDREIVKMLLSAYQIGCEDYKSGVLKGLGLDQLNEFVTPKLIRILNKLQNQQRC